MPTGRVRIDSNNDTGHTFHIESNSAWDYIEPTSKTKSVLRRSACLVYGTLAMRSAVSRHTFLELIDGFSGLAICDFNWREGHLSLHDAIGIAQKSQWLKINETELALLLEYFGLQQVTVLLQTMGIELCLITKGEQGYDVYGQEGLLLHGKAMKWARSRTLWVQVTHSWPARWPRTCKARPCPVHSAWPLNLQQPFVE